MNGIEERIFNPRVVLSYVKDKKKSYIIFANLSKRIKDSCNNVIDIEFYIPKTVLDFVMNNNLLDDNEKRAAILLLSGLYSYQKSMLRSKDRGDILYILSKTLEKTLYLYGIRKYSFFIDKLISIGILERGKKYKVGVQPKSYKLVEDRGKKLSRLKLSELNAMRNTNRKKVMLDYATKSIDYTFSMKNLYKATIDGYKEYEFDIEMYEKLLNMMRFKEDRPLKKMAYYHALEYCKEFNNIINLDHNSEYIITRPSGARIYSNFHIIPSKMKLYCLKRRDDKPFISLDIKNSQPAFLLSPIKKHVLQVEDEVVKSIERGSFYELLGSRLYKYSDEDITKDVNGIRKIIKKQVFTILYDKKRFKSGRLRKRRLPFFKKVKSAFPLFANTIIVLSNKSSGIAALMQKLEADVVLKVAMHYKLPSIHDSLLVNTHECDNIMRVLEYELRKRNVLCKISKTRIDHNDRVEKINNYIKLKVSNETTLNT